MRKLVINQVLGLVALTRNQGRAYSKPSPVKCGCSEVAN